MIYGSELQSVVAEAIFRATGLSLAEDGVQEVLEAISKAGYAIVPIKASDGLLVSMSMRWDHSFGVEKVEALPGYSLGYNQAEREALMTSMRQIHQEVVGTGFYNPDYEDRYKKVIQNGGNP